MMVRLRSKRALRIVMASVVMAILVGSLSVLGVAKVKITYFNWFADPYADKVEKEIIKLFNDSHPGIEVVKTSQEVSWSVWEKAVVMAAGGVPPDVVCVALNLGLSARRSGLLLDLKPFIEKDKFDMSLFRPGSELCLGPDWAWGGKVYGIPWGFGMLNLFYNKDMFEEVGLLLPYKGWTKQEFITACQRLTRDTNGDGKPDVFGIQSPIPEYNPWPFLDGGNFVDPKTGKLTLDDPRLIKSLEFIYDLYNRYKVCGAWPSGGMEDFQQSKVAMSYQWDSYIKRLLDLNMHTQFNWAVTWFPRSDDRTISYGHGHVISIMKDSPHPKEAWEFIKFYYSLDAQKILAKAFLYPMTQAGMRAIGEVTKFPKPLSSKEILEPYLNVDMVVTVPWWAPGISEALSKCSATFIQNVVAGKKSIQSWLEDFKKEVEIAAKQYEKK